MVKAMDCGIDVSEFVLQSRYYVHFPADTLGKGMNPPYPPSYGLNSTTTEELRPSLHFGVVAIEKGAFWSPSTMVANFYLLFF